MRRTLILRRDTLADLTPDDLASVVAGQQNRTLGCDSVLDCIAIRNPRELLESSVCSIVGCPISNGC